MPQTPEYKRGYSNGYQKGRGDQLKIEQRHQAELSAVAQRAERAEAASGIGHCENCQHWVKLQPSYSWGNCMATKAAGTPYGCWAQVNEQSTHRVVQISTSPQFGCVLFVAKANSSRDGGGE